MAEERVRFLPRLPKEADHDYCAAHYLAGVDLNVIIPVSCPARQALFRLIRVVSMVCVALPLLTAGCSDTAPNGGRIVDASSLGKGPTMRKADEYVIGSGDSLSIFVYRNPDLSEASVAVRPDGRISTPLIEDIVAAGKTPTILAREIEEKLKKYIQEPNVTVIVRGFIGPPDRQVRVIGEATDPLAIPYRDHMSLLDVMIAIKGLTKYASGNRSIIVRTLPDGKELSIRVRINDLIKDGDISQNIEMAPGDTLIIPQSWF
jgi:polysaccharide export outer membrane protein